MNRQSAHFNIHTALRLESIRLGELQEEAAVKRDEELYVLERKMASLATAKGGLRLENELNIIFTSVQRVIKKAIAYRKELAAKAPEMLHALPYLKKFHDQLDHIADGVMIKLRSHHEHPARQLRAGEIDVVLGAAVQKTSRLKAKISREIQAMALEGTLGMHGEAQTQVTLNISHSQIAGFNLGPVVGDLNSSIQILTATGRSELAGAAATERGDRRERSAR